MEPGDLFKWMLAIAVSACMLVLVAVFIKYSYDTWFKK